MRRSFALCMMLAACGGGVEPAPQAPPPDVDPDAIPEVISLSAASRLLPDQSTAIAYEVKNARAIEISVGDRTVLSTFESKGSVDSGPLRQDSIVTLTARNREHVVTTSRAIAVLWDLPAIDAFTTSFPQVLLGNSAELFWTARNVDVLRILRNGVEVFRSTEVTGAAQPRVDEEMTTFVLEVSNPRGTVTRELMVQGMRPVTLVRFAIHPRVWFGGVQQATIDWDVRDATAMTLDLRSLNSQNDRPDLLVGALQPAGSMSIEISEPATFGLFIRNPFSGNSYERRVEVLTEEGEPNDTIDMALLVHVGVRGDLERPGDVDFYEIPLDMGTSGLRVLLTGPDATGCPPETRLALHTLAGALASSDGCAALEVSAEQAAAISLAGSRLFFEVSSDSGATGAYLVLSEEL